MADPDASGSVPDALWRGALRAVAGDEVQRGAPSTSPVARYRDPGRHAREVAALRRLPHAIAPAARLAAAGDWLSTRLLDVPVLVTRGDDGAAARLHQRLPPSRLAGRAGRGLRHGAIALRLPVPQLDLRRPRLPRRPSARGRLPARAARARSLVPLPRRGSLRPGVGRSGGDRRVRMGPIISARSPPSSRRSASTPPRRARTSAASCSRRTGSSSSTPTSRAITSSTRTGRRSPTCSTTTSSSRRRSAATSASSCRSARSPRRRRAGGDVGWEQLGRHSNVIYFFFPEHLRALGRRSRQRLQRHAGDGRELRHAELDARAGRAARAPRAPRTGSATGRSSGTRSTRTSPSPRRCRRAWRAAPTRRSPSARTNSRATCSSGPSTRSSTARRRRRLARGARAARASSPRSCARRASSRSSSPCSSSPSTSWPGVSRRSSWLLSSWHRSSSPPSSSRRSSSRCLPGRALLGRALLRGALLRRRHLVAFAARLGQADRDRLLLARHLLAGAAALQRAVLALVHRFVDLVRRLLAIRCHVRVLVSWVERGCTGP